MTRRERLQRKVELRHGWAAKAHIRAGQAYEGAQQIADAIPLGQPILVGHHSERRARRDAGRIQAGMQRAMEQSALAQHHEDRASGLARQLERAIFDDDPDAIERLQEKIAGLEANCERLSAANRLWRKGGREALVAEFGEELAAAAAQTMAQGLSWIRRPFDLTSNRAEIRRCRQRILQIQAQQSRTARAVEVGGVCIEGDHWVTITFTEKPERSVREALRNAGFRWAQGGWRGPRDRLPTELAAQWTQSDSAALKGQS